MKKVAYILNRYGVIIHVLSIALWLWVIWTTYPKIESGEANLPIKLAFYGNLVLLALSVWNLINALRRRRKL
ncbi:MAG TPA: hypothetical protein VGB50_11345 [Flavobacterium sp.]|jgi:uncharacterized membrane protein (DUF2068 family)